MLAFVTRSAEFRKMTPEQKKEAVRKDEEEEMEALSKEVREHIHLYLSGGLLKDQKGEESESYTRFMLYHTLCLVVRNKKKKLKGEPAELNFEVDDQTIQLLRQLLDKMDTDFRYRRDEKPFVD